MEKYNFDINSRIAEMIFFLLSWNNIIILHNVVYIFKVTCVCLNKIDECEIFAANIPKYAFIKTYLYTHLFFGANTNSNYTVHCKNSFEAVAFGVF